MSKIRTIVAKLTPSFRKILSSISWYLLEKILLLFISFFVSIYVIRYLGPEDFGKLSYAISFVGLFAVIAQLGLENVVIRNLVREEQSNWQILGTAFTLQLIASIVTISLILGISYLINQDAQIQTIVLLISLSLLFKSFEVIDLWFKSKVIAKPMVLVRSSTLILGAIIKLLFIQYSVGLVAFAWLLLVQSIIKSIAMLWTYKIYKQSMQEWRFNKQKASSMLKDSYPLMFSSIAIVIYLKIDQVMLGNMSSTSEVGNYAAAIRFSEIWYFLPMTICSSVFPSIVRMKERNQEEYRLRLQQLYDFMAWLAWIIVIGISIFSGLLTNTLLGEQYIKAGSILMLHIWATPFVFLGVSRTQWLIAENLNHLSFQTTILGALTNIVLNFYWIPSYGGMGAALATVISYAIASYFSSIVVVKMRQQFIYQTKALLIPFRWQQNLSYLEKIRNFF